MLGHKFYEAANFLNITSLFLLFSISVSFLLMDGRRTTIMQNVILSVLLYNINLFSNYADFRQLLTACLSINNNSNHCFLYFYHSVLLGITKRKLNINPQNNLSRWKFISLVITTFFLMSDVTPHSQLKRNRHNIPLTAF
jgi:hypothetical protein